MLKLNLLGVEEIKIFGYGDLGKEKKRFRNYI